jgi:lysophospholipase L1-like esterase
MESPIYYVALGDSLTEGTGASNNKYTLANRYFEAIKRTPDCSFINLGRSGLTSEELLLSLLHPDINNKLKHATDITITIGGNDLIEAYLNTKKISIFFTVLSKLESNVKQILNQIFLENPNANVTLVGLYNPGQPVHPLYTIANMVIKKVNLLFVKLVVTYSYQFIDPFDHFLNKPFLLADEVHPNDLGYQTLFDLIIQYKKKYFLPELRR